MQEGNLPEKSVSIYQTVFVVILASVLAAMPFFRGLFFAKEYTVFSVLLFLLVIIWSIGKSVRKDPFVHRTWLVPVVTFLLLAYLLPLLTGQAVNQYGAYDSVLRYSLVIVIFILSSDLLRDGVSRKIFLHILLVPGVLGAFLAVDSALGDVLTKVLSLSEMGSDGYRVYGLLQYANASAALFGLTGFILIMLSIEEKKAWLRALYSSLLGLMLPAMLVTLSRGGMMTFAFVYFLLYFLLHGKTDKIRYMVSSVPAMIVGGIGATGVYQCFTSINQAIAAVQPFLSTRLVGYGILICSMVIAYLLTFFAVRSENQLNRVSNSTYRKIILFGAILLGIALILVFVTGLYEKIIPQSIIDRFNLTSADKTNGRTSMYQDAWGIIEDHLFVGAGGGAWNSLYRSYQHVLYDSSEVHRYVIQIILESGIVGLAALLFLVVSAGRLFLRLRKTSDSRQIVMAIGCVLMLFLQATMDFNFSYLSLLLLMFAFLGFFHSFTDESYSVKKIPASIPVSVCTLLAVIMGYNTANAAYARTHATEVTEHYSGDQVQVRTSQLLDDINTMTDAANDDPWNTSYRVMEKAVDGDYQYDLNTLCSMAENILSSPMPNTSETAEQKQQREEILQQVLQVHQDAIEGALKQDPYNPIINMEAASFYTMKINAYSLGLSYMDKAIEYGRMDNGRYEEMAQGYLFVADQYIEAGNLEDAKKLLTRIANLEQEVQDWAKTNQTEIMTLTDQTKVYIKQAQEKLQQLG